MCADFADPRSHDLELRHKNIKRTAIFGLKTYLFTYNFKTTWHAKLKFELNMGTYECFVQTEFGASSQVTRILQVEYRQKVDKFEPICLVNY